MRVARERGVYYYVQCAVMVTVFGAGWINRRVHMVEGYNGHRARPRADHTPSRALNRRDDNRPNFPRPEKIKQKGTNSSKGGLPVSDTLYTACTSCSSRHIPTAICGSPWSCSSSVWTPPKLTCRICTVTFDIEDFEEILLFNDLSSSLPALERTPCSCVRVRVVRVYLPFSKRWDPNARRL